VPFPVLNGLLNNGHPQHYRQRQEGGPWPKNVQDNVRLKS
jgi:hypothetical protein